jgi:branched-chain amino acid transport system substrate-binding protein
MIHAPDQVFQPTCFVVFDEGGVFMKRVLSIALVAMLALAVIVAGCAKKEEAAKQPIKLGVAGPHSGDLASYGIPTVRAAELVVEKFNKKGGVLGRPVELFVEDDVCKPEIATNTATKLVSDGVNVVLRISAPAPRRLPSGSTKMPRS